MPGFLFTDIASINTNIYLVTIFVTYETTYHYPILLYRIDGL